MAETISLKEFGRRVKVSDKTIGYGIKTGKISKGVTYDENGRPRILYEIALKEFEETGMGRKVIGIATTPRVHSKPVNDGKDDQSEDTELLSYAQAIQAKENYIAKIKELEFKEKEGQLIDKDVVFKQLFVFAQEIRDAFQSLPNQIAANVAACDGNLNKITSILTTSIHDVLTKLSELDKKEIG